MAKFNEDTRVKIPATIHFMRLGYDYQSFKEARNNDWINEETNIFLNRFKPAIERINNESFSDSEIDNLIRDMYNVIKNNDLGKEFYNWLINPMDRIKLIDFDNISNNDFAVVCELPFKSKKYSDSFRPDITILINGIPLSFLEVKKPNNPGGIQQEFNRMKNDRLIKDYYKHYFNLLQILSFSNNMEYEELIEADNVRAGSFYTTPNGAKTNFSFLREEDESYLFRYDYKEIDMITIRSVTKDCGYDPDNAETVEFKTNLNTSTPCNSFITSLYDQERMLYLIKYGLMYIEDIVPEKHIMRYPQFFATRNIIQRLKEGGKNGIIWHTQGSGKTALAAFSNNIIKDYYYKQDISTRFFFVVDRLELLEQAKREFKKRGFNVITCKNKKEFVKELNNPLSKNIPLDSTGEICVVNIHKFIDDIPKSKNDYDIEVQRVFFVDEAHRSYSTTGEFFKNLLSCDLDGVFLALTGTPILNKKEKSNLKFGDYIHKYFYDKSIADGYTLKIRKETIDTQVKKRLRKELKITDDTDLDDPDKFESFDYISGLGRFIEEDFKEFRVINRDDTVGAMIVCKTNPQAEKMYDWFKDNSDLNTALVISSENPEQNRFNKINQTSFRNPGNTENPLDLLVVNRMLTTGYDVARLKKLYLLRGPHAHSLLQTISRVNRPYKSPNGRNYEYGYIVDFVDIENEYETTLEEYIKELESDFKIDGELQGTLTDLVVDKKYIYDNYIKYESDLKNLHLDVTNSEIFSQQLAMLNKETLYKVKKSLSGMKNCYIELLTSRNKEELSKINYNNIKDLLKCTQNRISFINIKDKPIENINELSEEEIGNIVYEFKKVKISLLKLDYHQIMDEEFTRLWKALQAVQHEIKSNKNKEDIGLLKLNQWLTGIFDDLNNSELKNLNEITDEVLEVLKEIQRINKENDNIINKYGGNEAFLKTYQYAIANYPIEKEDLDCMFTIIYKDIEDIDTEVLIKRGRRNFITQINQDTSIKLYKHHIFNKVNQYYEPILNEMYSNL